MGKTVLITGTSSGFGFLTARTLAGKGFTVFAGMRKTEGRNAGKARELIAYGKTTPGAIHVLEMDVTDDSLVNEAVKKTVEIGGGIDVVINNAGCGVSGWLEAFPVEQLKAQFDVNVFGLQRVNRAVIPFMRKQRSGLIVHISSTLGRQLLPFTGPYSACKFAVEALAESYHFELAHFDIDSVIVEPGGFGTNFTANMQYASDYDRIASLGVLADLPMRIWEGTASPDRGTDGEKTGSCEDAGVSGSGSAGGFMPGDPRLVVDAIVNLIEMPYGTRPLRTVVDPLGGEGVKAINKVCAEVQAEVFKCMGVGV